MKNYTTGTTAARLAGKNSDTKTATNIPVNLTFSVESIDMTDYGNGFRGIGSSYGNNRHVWNTNCSIPEVYRRNLLIQSINTDRAEDTVITLNMNQNDYYTEYSTGVWRNCQTAHCGRRRPHFAFGVNTSPIVPYRYLPQTLRGMAADCRSFV